MNASAAAPELVIEPFIPRVSWRRRTLRLIRREPLGVLGALLIFLIVFGALAAPMLHTRDPQAFSQDLLQGPSSEHLFGTTRQGKDVWSRVLYGGRISLKIGVATVAVGLVAATLLALLAGFVGGIVDFVVGRVTDVMLAFPSILFALTLKTAIGDDLPDLPGLSREELVLIIAISVLFLPSTFRIMRGSVLEQRQSAYVEAARVLGAGEWRIMLRHILPNLTGLLIVLSTTALPAAILTESSLSFLGVGVPVGTPSWGADLNGTSRTFFVRAPWIAIFPGLALSITVFAFNMLGDSLRDTLDPRLRGRI
ncbi:MAG: ABC transporter permease [Dehalococcoidia bacterium]